jgi:antitoxin HigA-1
MSVSLHASMAVHPGPWLRRNVVQHHRMSVADAARWLHMRQPAMSDLLNGRTALSEVTALRVEDGFGIPAATLLRMQANYDAAKPARHYWSAHRRPAGGEP